MYISIIMRKSGNDKGDIIHYPKIALFDEDMKLWKHISWAYLYDEETGDEIRHYQAKTFKRRPNIKRYV